MRSLVGLGALLLLTGCAPALYVPRDDPNWGHGPLGRGYPTCAPHCSGVVLPETTTCRNDGSGTTECRRIAP